MNYTYGFVNGKKWIQTPDAFYQSDLHPEKIAEIESDPANIGTEYVRPPLKDDD